MTVVYGPPVDMSGFSRMIVIDSKGEVLMSKSSDKVYRPLGERWRSPVDKASNDNQPTGKPTFNDWLRAFQGTDAALPSSSPSAEELTGGAYKIEIPKEERDDAGGGSQDSGAEGRSEAGSGRVGLP